jgi:triosephosphate isomerase
VWGSSESQSQKVQHRERERTTKYNFQLKGEKQKTMSAQRKAFVGGNWKCNGTKESVAALVEIYNQAATEGLCKEVDVLIAPTALHIPGVLNSVSSEVKVAAQNIWSAAGYGAYTGELTADMVKDFGLQWVITGHSERRHHVSSETSEVVAQKTKSALTSGLNVIACIGEKLEEREANSTMAVLQSQLQPLIDMIPLDSDEWNRVVIAYEPVWAIGTGLTATPEQAEEVHANLRSWLNGMGDAGASLASKLRIIYGGSVKPANSEQLISCSNIDGFLVGGCSLKPDILDICRSCQPK